MPPYSPPPRTWRRKLGDAYRGLRLAVLGQSSFTVHGLGALGVLGLAVGLGASHLQGALLAGCVAAVWTTELLNTSLEHLAKAVTQEENPHVGRALDIASAAVLTASLGSVLVGALVLLDMA